MGEDEKPIIFIPREGNYIEILGHKIDGYSSFESFLEELKELKDVREKNKELENNLDKVEGKCGELFAVLFTVIRNNTVLPKGEELGKSQIEITQMTVKTIDALIEKIDYEKVRDLLKEAGEM